MRWNSAWKRQVGVVALLAVSAPACSTDKTGPSTGAGSGSATGNTFNPGAALPSATAGSSAAGAPAAGSTTATTPSSTTPVTPPSAPPSSGTASSPMAAGTMPASSAANGGGAATGSNAPSTAASSGSGAATTGSGGSGAANAGSMGIAMTGGAGANRGTAGTPATGSPSSGRGGASKAPTLTGGKCCPDGNCLCHGDPPNALTSRLGPFKTAQVLMGSGTAVYPTNADPPLAALSICPGFLNVGPEMAAWGPFYASWGIVTVITNTGAADIPAIRAGLLLGAIDELKRMNTDMKSPLYGKLSGRYGTSGYSMGGGGTTIAAQGTPSLSSSVGLAAWGGDGTRNSVPELLFCGDADVVAPCIMSDAVYADIPDSTPKMEVVVPLATHFDWFGPSDMSGSYALAFQKVYLEGDTRWKSLLLSKPALGSMRTNIK